MIFGIQQWGIRELCKKNTEKLYGELAENGITRFEPCVALSKLGGIEKQIWDVKECMKQYNIMMEFGIRVDSVHVFADDFLANKAVLLELVRNIPLKQVVMKMPQELTKERMLEAAYTYMIIADCLEQYGVKLALHNEQMDIETKIDSVSAYEWIIDACLDKVFMQVDVGWLLLGGEDPETFLWKNRHHITSVHYKDFAGKQNKEEVIYGQGIVDVNACLQFARAAGALQIFDQDQYGIDKMADIHTACEAVDAFAQSRKHTISFLNILDIETGEVKVLHKFDRVIEAPNWLKTQDCIIYNSEGHIWAYSISSDTENMLDSGYCDNCNNDHVVSADEQYIAIGHSTEKGDWRESRIYKIPINGGEPQPLIERAPSFLHGWNPEQTEVAYCGFRMYEGKMAADIYSCSLDGKEERKLTEVGYNDGPEYSPKGDKIWFNSTKSNLMQVYRMNKDGSNPEQMTQGECNNWFGHVSPDGKKVVYLSFGKDELLPHEHLPNMKVELWLMNSDGSDAHKILSLFGGQGSINVNSWNKDSRRFAFVSYELLHK